MYKVVRVLNNNVVLAVTDDDSERSSEVILTGWGVGFGQKPGRTVDPVKVKRVFIPEFQHDPAHLSEMLAHVPYEYVSCVSTILADLAPTLDIRPGVAVVVALADHIHYAEERARAGIDVGRHPLEAEVHHLYPHEVSVAQKLLERVNAWLAKNDPSAVPLPRSEVTALTMHLVNAGFTSDNLSAAYTMTGVFSQIFAVIDAEFGISTDQHSVNAARFITHLRYFFARVSEGKQLTTGADTLAHALESEYPRVYHCAELIGTILQLRLNCSLEDAEIAYLALHVLRLVGDQRTQ